MCNYKTTVRFPNLEKIREFLLLISYFIHWMHYPNIAPDCAFDMHKQERGRQGGREAGREKKTEGARERAAFFFCQRSF